MILSKAGKLSLLAGLLCLLLMGFAGASYGAVRFDVVPSPTEVINTGRSEVLGSANLVVFSTGLTGTATGGDAQIGLIFSNGVQIDNNTNRGIRLTFSSSFQSGTVVPYIVAVQNLTITGRCTGFVTINIPAGRTVNANDYIRVEGIRGRIDLSDGAVAGTDLYVQLQSINDPAANTFYPETVRVAKSLPGLVVDVKDANMLLCFPPYGVVPGAAVPNYYIKVTEGFVRAFVSNDGNILNRVDSGNPNLQPPLTPIPPQLLGDPTNSTQIRFVLNSIPASISAIGWPTTSTTYSSGGFTSYLQLVTDSATYSGGVSEATYTFVTQNQTNMSDINLETYTVRPELLIGTSNQDTGTVLAAAALYPFAESPASCGAPKTSNFVQPRFATLYQSSNSVTSTDKKSTTFDLYATIIRCNCFLLFTYVTKDNFWNTGIVVANTTGDAEVFGSIGAPKQLGPITFYFYDKAAGYVGATTTTASYGPGTSFVALLSQILPSTVTSFSGYVIAKAQFQYCHGFAFIADGNFGTIAQGYLANVIPDPAIKGGWRMPAAAGDPTNLAAGESINN